MIADSVCSSLLNLTCNSTTIRLLVALSHIHIPQVLSAEQPVCPPNYTLIIETCANASSPSCKCFNITCRQSLLALVSHIQMKPNDSFSGSCCPGFSGQNCTVLTNSTTPVSTITDTSTSITQSSTTTSTATLTVITKPTTAANSTASSSISVFN